MAANHVNGPPNHADEFLNHADEFLNHADEFLNHDSLITWQLPRPLVINREMAAHDEGMGDLAAADQMLREEMVRATTTGLTTTTRARTQQQQVRMLEADAYAYPVKGAPEARKRKRLKPVPDALREEAVRPDYHLIIT